MDASCPRLRIACFLLTTLIAYPATSDIYRCPQADGFVQFSDAVCEDGTTETVTLQINSALDSSAERENIASYNQSKLYSQTDSPSPRLLLITDTRTEERNARITSQSISDTKSKQRKRKNGKKKKLSKKIKKKAEEY